MVKDKIKRQDLKLYFRKLHEIKMLESGCMEPDKRVIRLDMRII